MEAVCFYPSFSNVINVSRFIVGPLIGVLFGQFSLSFHMSNAFES